jgi:hypothetical protein
MTWHGCLWKIAALLGGVALIGALAPHGGVSVASVGALGTGPSSVAGIPARYLADYRAAGTMCPRLDWAILAGIGVVETNHGQSHLPGVVSGANFAGAAGPMQFLTSTFASVRARHPDVGPDIYSPDAAIPAAAHLLCDNGYAANPYAAIFSYNHADWYVREVQGRAAAYRTVGT